MAKLKFDRGTTYARTITYKKNGVIVPLTGMTVFFTMKSEEYDGDAADGSALVMKNMANLSDTDAAEGRAIVTILPNDTKDITPGDYFYDIKIREDADHIYKVDEGTITLDGSPTNRVA